MHQPDLQGGAGAVHIELGPKEVFLVALGKLWGPPKPKLCKNSMGIITGTPEVYMRHVSNKAWSFNSL